jgi:hypothetical protein
MKDHQIRASGKKEISNNKGNIFSKNTIKGQRRAFDLKKTHYNPVIVN